MEIKDFGDGKRRLTSDLVYCDPWGGVIVVPKGFVTDFASLPDLARFACIALILLRFLESVSALDAWRVLLWVLEAFCCFVILISDWLENSSTDAIATVHDWIYATRCRKRSAADVILYCGMDAKGAPKSGVLKSVLFFVNVRLFGWKPWMDDKKKHRKLTLPASASTPLSEVSPLSSPPPG